MTDFLLELFSEEIPARMQPAAAAQLKTAFEALLSDAGLTAARVETHATPRRLALLAHDLPSASEATREERRGPRADAPEQAIAGFLKSTGLDRSALEERADPKGRFLYAVIAREGRPTADLLAERLPGLIAGFQWPKSMRWGAASASTASPRWVRPLRRIVALLDSDVVAFEALGVASGRETFGHRFMSSGPVQVTSPATYLQQLRDVRVIVSTDERSAAIRDGAAAKAAEAGLTLIPDEGLVAENAGLTEWPMPLLGRFDPAFLTVPREVIQLTMRTNQKYFAVADADGRLAPAFVCVANIEAPDAGRTIIAGNERVLSARLSDARFFWDRDLATPLEDLVPRLNEIVFQADLGTIANKVSRNARIACALFEQKIIVAPDLPLEQLNAYAPEEPIAEFYDKIGITTVNSMLANIAVKMAKCDLLTGTVGEFPEVQGVVGSKIAAAQLPPGPHSVMVANAIRDQYKPVGLDDVLPNEPISVAVALADKLDTLVAFFAINLVPTGSKDPYALRRAAIGAIRLILAHGLRINLRQFLTLPMLRVVSQQIVTRYNDLQGQVVSALTLTGQTQAEATAFFKSRIEAAEAGGPIMDEVAQLISNGHQGLRALMAFFADRLKVQQRDAGTRHDVIDAVFVLGDDDLVRLLARVRALQAFITTPDGANLLAGYKRAANILKKEGFDGPAATDATAPNLEPAERALTDALAASTPAVAQALEAEDFEAAMRALATLRAPVDAFFDTVKVNADDPAVRERRLALLATVRDAMHQVADFSRIEG